MFEIYLYSDQTNKRGHGGHVRFVAGRDEHEATHKVAFVWGHWWRTCGIREVDMHYWCDTHSTLVEGKSIVAVDETNEYLVTALGGPAEEVGATTPSSSP
jgi:hypothetical protein